jgi:hypothetical protein
VRDCLQSFDKDLQEQKIIKTKLLSIKNYDFKSTEKFAEVHKKVMNINLMEICTFSLLLMFDKIIRLELF